MNSILDTNAMGIPQNILQGSTSYENDLLIFITGIGSLELKSLNHRAVSYFQNAIHNGISEGNFFKRIVHPEEFSLFEQYLRTIKDLHPGQKAEICLRLQSPFGYWKKFLIKSRLYEGFGPTKELYAISTAQAFDQRRNQGRKEKYSNLEAEKALQENLERHKALVNSLDQGFCIIEILLDLQQQPIDYLFLENNPAFEKHTLLKNSTGRTMKEFADDHEDHWFQQYGKVACTGESVRFENYAAVFDRWLDVFAFPIGSRKSKKVALLFSDITQRKKTEEELKKANETLEFEVKKRTKELKEKNRLLQMIFDTGRQGIVLLKPIFGTNSDISDFSFVRTNKIINRYYRQKSMIGKSFLKFNKHATKNGLFETLKQTMLSGEGTEFEVCLEQDERKNWFRITAHRQKGLLVNSIENITRQKLKANKLKKNIRFKKQLISTSPDVILIFNLKEEKVRFLNRGLSEEPEMSPKKLVGMPLMDILPLIHPQDRQKALEFHTRLVAASDKDIMELEFRLRGKERSWEFYHARAKVFMRNKKGKVCEYIIMLRNVQEHKKTQQALIKAEKLSIKGEVARTLAHELRNPIASIGMSADILEKKLGPEESHLLQNYIHIIRRSTTTLNSMITDLLSTANYSKIELGKCCLGRITNSALAHAQDRIYLAGVRVVKNYTGPYYISADEEKLKIALLNIIVNASEAMVPEEGVLTLSIKKERNFFKMMITDNGCGMVKEELEQLFNSFYTNKPDGMGIGLNSVKNIIDDHEAGIEVKSEPGEGTTFTLSFPCYQAS